MLLKITLQNYDGINSTNHIKKTQPDYRPQHAPKLPFLCLKTYAKRQVAHIFATK